MALSDSLVSKTFMNLEIFLQKAAALDIFEALIFNYKLKIGLLDPLAFHFLGIVADLANQLQLLYQETREQKEYLETFQVAIANPELCIRKPDTHFIHATDPLLLSVKTEEHPITVENDPIVLPLYDDVPEAPAAAKSCAKSPTAAVCKQKQKISRASPSKKGEDQAKSHGKNEDQDLENGRQSFRCSLCHSHCSMIHTGMGLRPLALVLLLLVLPLSSPAKHSSLQHPPSPCPSIFSYEGREAEPGRWFGVILLNVDQIVTGLRLDIKLDKPANVLGVGTAPSTKTPPSSLPPEVSERVEEKDEEEPPTESDGSGQCGLVSVQPAPLVSHGQNTARGQFPWHAALYQSKDLNPVYKCGGSLIGPKTILTAAHCASKGSSVVRPVDPEILFVYLGKYHLNQWSEGGVQVKQVLKVLLHPDYNSSNYRSDLALLILTSPVQFTKYVRPICLWDSQQTALANVVNQQGTVAGWGYDETGKVTEELKMAKMPIVAQDVCLFSDRDFYPQFTSDKTYCAGFLNGTSVCNGDSGGGMVFSKKQAGGPVRWSIRGIVSLSKPKKQNQHMCDTESYIVFTDVAKHLDWIQANVQ